MKNHRHGLPLPLRHGMPLCMFGCANGFSQANAYALGMHTAWLIAPSERFPIGEGYTRVSIRIRIITWDVQ